jgi:hypothetical protein
MIITPAYWNTFSGISEVAGGIRNLTPLIISQINPVSSLIPLVEGIGSLSKVIKNSIGVYKSALYFNGLSEKTTKYSEKFFTSAETSFTVQDGVEVIQEVDMFSKNSCQVSALSIYLKKISDCFSYIIKGLSWPIKTINLHFSINSYKKDPLSDKSIYSIIKVSTGIILAVGSIFLSQSFPISYPILSSITSLSVNSVSYVKIKEEEDLNLAIEKSNITYKGQDLLQKVLDTKQIQP